MRELASQQRRAGEDQASEMRRLAHDQAREMRRLARQEYGGIGDAHGGPPWYNEHHEEGISPSGVHFSHHSYSTYHVHHG